MTVYIMAYNAPPVILFMGFGLPPLGVVYHGGCGTQDGVCCTVGIYGTLTPGTAVVSQIVIGPSGIGAERRTDPNSCLVSGTVVLLFTLLYRNS